MGTQLYAYSNTAVVTTQTGLSGTAGTTATLGSATGWPATAAGPPTVAFKAVLEPGTANAEVIIVGTRSGTALSAITRGAGGTTAITHASGCVIAHEADAVDAAEWNAAAQTLIAPTITANVWNAPTMSNSWVSAAVAGTATPGYLLDPNGIVWLRGMIKAGTANTAAFTLPAGLRPAFDKYVNCHANSGSDTFGRLRIGANGTITPTLTWTNQISLEEISFLAEQ
jgi:hypothetical protein